MINPYAQLCTEFYDLTKPEAPSQEVAFYGDALKSLKGPVLEPMCGSGRLLIPLAKKGIDIEGTDYSEHMLASCRERLAQNGLTVPLYHQAIEDLALPKQYAAIIIPVASFQLIYQRESALQVLQRLHDHLKPGGLLMLDTFIPWDEIYAQGQATVSEAIVPADATTVLKATNTSAIERDEQLCASTIVYEKIQNNQIIKTETEQYKLRWYYHFEMLLFLQKAGFDQITAHAVDFEKDPQGVIYTAYRPLRS